MTSTTVDRPAAIRRALRELVAENGFHGASMGAVAREAGVATGTAYVHYDSKEELVYATYLEIKAELAEAVLPQVELDAEPRDRFIQMWTALYRYYESDLSKAKFLVQLEGSPFFAEAKRRLEEAGDPIVEQAARPDLVESFVDLPMDVLYAFSLGMAVRLVAAEVTLSDAEIGGVAAASWRAISTS